ncbi:hypothetical protein ACFL4T_13080 [candidate division KSB1 bacterium]
MTEKYNSKLMVVISDLDKMGKSMKKEMDVLKGNMKEMNKKMDQILKRMK